jgi:acetylglutamate kinase
VIRVIKIGGRAQNDPSMAAMIRSAWLDAPGSLCIVHGGGDEVSALQRAMGREATFIGGRRVTSKADLALLRMVLSGVVNKRLVNAFITAGVPAVGISGEDGALLESEIIDASALGFAGQPRRINATLLKTLLAAGYMPVISPVGYDATSGGGALNVNGDDAAAAIAVALGADELLFVADVEGVHNDRGEAYQYLTFDQAKELISSGTAAGGMAAKLESANAATSSGIERVRVAAVQGIANPNCGTFITQAEGIAS